MGEWSLLSNGGVNTWQQIAEPEETAVARQWLGKHVSLAKDMHTQK
jgi:hypothetical protein